MDLLLTEDLTACLAMLHTLEGDLVKTKDVPDSFRIVILLKLFLVVFFAHLYMHI